MFALAAQSLTKKVEQDNSMQSKRVAQKLEMTEAELTTKKREFEAEKMSMFSKLQELERERATVKAKESNIHEKLDNLRDEKEKYEKLYLESVQNYKEREGKIDKEMKEKIGQIENKYELTKTENFQLSSNNDKKLALLEQELSFTKRENESLIHKMELYDNENKRLKADTSQSQALIDVNYINIKCLLFYELRVLDKSN